jgi:predicted flap endonuclease-1-like 5' DNA nuclease
VAWFFGQPILVIVLGFVLGLGAGWSLWGRGRAASSPAPAAERATLTDSVPAAVTEPAAQQGPVMESVPAAATVPAGQRATGMRSVPGAATEPAGDQPPVHDAAEAAPIAADAGLVTAVEPSMAAEAAPVAAGHEPIAAAEAAPAAEPSAVPKPARAGRLRKAEPDADADRTVGAGGPASAPDGIEPYPARPKRTPVAEPDLPEPVAATPAGFPGQRTATAAGPATRTGDDLKRIEGIGPKMAAALGGAGITTYAGLAAADDLTIRAALTAAGIRIAPNLPTWRGQAKLLADGDEAGFAEVSRRLKPR